MNFVLLHKGLNLLIARCHENHQDSFSQLSSLQSFPEEIEDDLVRNGIEIGDAIDAGNGRIDGEIEKGRRGTRGQ